MKKLLILALIGVFHFLLIACVVVEQDRTDSSNLEWWVSSHGDQCDDHVESELAIEAKQNRPNNLIVKLKVEEDRWVYPENCADVTNYSREAERKKISEKIESCIIKIGGELEEVGRAKGYSLMLYSNRESGGTRCPDGAMFLIQSAEIEEREVLDSEWLKETNTKIWDLLRGYYPQLALNVVVPKKQWVYSENLEKTRDSCLIHLGDTVKEVGLYKGDVLLRYSTKNHGGTSCRNGTLFFLSEETFKNWKFFYTD